MKNKVLIGKVGYSKKENRFIQIRRRIKGGYVCGGFCEFYLDSKTNICEQPLSDKKIKSFKIVPVGFLDKFKYAKFNQAVGAYEVKDRRKP